MVICHCSYMQKVTKTLHVAYTCTARSCMNFHEDLFKLHALVTCKMWLWNLYHKYSINHILPMKNYLKNILKNNVKNFWNSKFHVMNFDSSWNGNPFPPILITHGPHNLILYDCGVTCNDTWWERFIYSTQKLSRHQR